MVIERICAGAVPFVIAACAMLILTSKKPLFDSFIEGMREGADTAVRLFPTLCALCIAVAMFTACGASDAIAGVLERFGIPEGLAGFLILRPISGGASTAMLTDIFETYGADSPAGLAASVIMASGDTVVYIISVYHAAAGIKNSRRTLAAAMLTMLVSMAAAIILCGRMFH